MADSDDGFVLLGSPDDETRLLIHRGCGFSLALPGHPALAPPAQTSPRYDTLVRLSDLPVEHGFRLDALPDGIEPRALALSVATTFASERADAPPSPEPLPSALRARGADIAVRTSYVVRGESPTTVELLVVTVRRHERGVWVLYHTVRHAVSELDPVQWANIRAAVLAHQHWEPRTPRMETPSVWPKESALAEPSVAMTLSAPAWSDARSKAADIGRLEDQETERLVRLLVDIANGDLPPASEIPSFMHPMIARQIIECGPARAAETICRGLDSVRTAHDLRAWCWGNIWAIGNRARVRTDRPAG
jgi:hypothetical protein